MFSLALLRRLAAGCAAFVAASVAFAATEVSNFALYDQRGRLFELRRTDARAVVLFFTANGCPVARQYTPKLNALRDAYASRGVEIVLVNSNSGDDRASIVKEMRDLKTPYLPVLKDDTQGVARHLRVGRTGDTVAISTKDWSVFYRGAVDDQVTEGAQKPNATARYLEDALEAFLAGKPIAEPKTAAHGCVLSFDAANGADDAPVSYAKDVAPILEKHCVSCHSAGNIGSWAMSSHRKVKGMSAMIEEVLLARRMPPWDADPAIGKFANMPAFTVGEAQTLLRWIHQGAPPGEGEDPLPKIKVAAAPDWPLGPPDIVMRLPKPEEIPATGVVPYRHIEVRANNETEGWVRAVYIRPGNLKVVHHVLMRAKDGPAQDQAGAIKMYAAWAPGASRAAFPGDSGRYLPAKARFDVEMHYTTNGTAQTDQTEIGIYLAKEKPAQAFEAVALVNNAFEIRPGDPASQAQATYFFRRDATLHSLTPHMHLRGRAMKFELLYPNGRREVVCSVPRYDFNWQVSYELAQPKKIPAGTWAMITGTWDNSKLNRANPDPTKTVRWGEQSWDEMLLGWYNVTWDHETPASATKAAAARTE